MLGWRRLLVLVAVAALPFPAGAHFLWFGKKKPVERIMIVTAATPRPLPRPVPPPLGRATCIDVRRVAGAQLFGDAAVELTVQGGARYRMYFAQGCPALDFYQGFYYRRAELGHLCAGRDAVISRAGGECAIASIMPVPKPRSAVQRHRHEPARVLHRRHAHQRLR